MTHEELLAKLKNFEPDNELDASASMYALRAVMELHKPDEDEKFCQECATLTDQWAGDAYPCATIQAIEKELN